MKLLEENQCIVLDGEAGSRKTTHIPHWYVFIFNSKVRFLISISCFKSLNHCPVSMVIVITYDFSFISFYFSWLRSHIPVNPIQ
jgi:hypothetical protein